MTIQVLERSRAPAPASPHFTLSHDEDGWTLLQPDGRARQFDTFEAGIESARETALAPTMPIDVWQDGQYICCLPPGKWPHSSHPAATAPKPLFPATERHANRAARLLMPAVGMFFWLALMVVALAASLGWRIMLL
jgi:hypothetical protein